MQAGRKTVVVDRPRSQVYRSRNGKAARRISKGRRDSRVYENPKPT